MLPSPDFQEWLQASSPDVQRMFTELKPSEQALVRAYWTSGFVWALTRESVLKRSNDRNAPKGV